MHFATYSVVPVTVTDTVLLHKDCKALAGNAGAPRQDRTAVSPLALSLRLWHRDCLSGCGIGIVSQAVALALSLRLWHGHCLSGCGIGIVSQAVARRSLSS